MPDTGMKKILAVAVIAIIAIIVLASLSSTNNETTQTNSGNTGTQNQASQSNTPSSGSNEPPPADMMVIATGDPALDTYYFIKIYFEDETGSSVSPAGTLDITIKDENNNILFNKTMTITKENYTDDLSPKLILKIPINQVTPGTSEYGSLTAVFTSPDGTKISDTYPLLKIPTRPTIKFQDIQTIVRGTPQSIANYVSAYAFGGITEAYGEANITLSINYYSITSSLPITITNITVGIYSGDGELILKSTSPQLPVTLQPNTDIDFTLTVESPNGFNGIAVIYINVSSAQG